MDKLRLRPKSGVADLGKMLTTLEVAPLFPSARALALGLMLAYSQALSITHLKIDLTSGRISALEPSFKSSTTSRLPAV
jgi:hypothetical protein